MKHLPREPPMIDYNAKGQRGLTDEKLVIQWLRDKGYVIIDSSPHENRALDIDIWLRSKTQTDADGAPLHLPMSIKCLHDGDKFNNFGIEVDVLRQVGTDDNGNPSYEWSGSSWFQNGEAVGYIVLQGNVIYKVRKQALLEAWESGKLIPERERTLRAETVQKQRDMGHPHIDARCVYFNRDHLKTLGIMQRLGTLDGKPEKSYGSITPSHFKQLAQRVRASNSRPAPRVAAG